MPRSFPGRAPRPKPILFSRIRLICALLALVLPSWLRATQESEPADPELRRQEILQRKRQEKSQQLVPYRISRGESRVLTWEKRRVKLMEKGFNGARLLIGGISDPAIFGSASSGSGFVAGIGYISGLEKDSFQFTFNARYSTRTYEELDANLEFPAPRSEARLKAFVRAGYRDYKEVNFFGLGPQTSVDGRTSFRLEDRRAVAGLTLLPHSTTVLRAGVGLLDTHILPGRRAPSFDQIFPPADVPGAVTTPDYLVYIGQAGFSFFDRGFPPAGISLQLEALRFDNRSQEQFNFTRLIGDFRTEIPLGYRNRRLAFRFRTSHALPDAGQEVPFYHMETLGGGTTLRGFDNYRFRGPRNLLMNLEYRWEVWTYADFALFSDAGKVFARAGDFDFSDLEASYGFGLLIRAPLGGMFRIDIAKSHEGFKIHLGSGPFVDKSVLNPPRGHFPIGPPRKQR